MGTGSGQAFSRREFVFVVFGAFAPFIASSLASLARPEHAAEFSNAGLFALVCYEIALGTILLAFLHYRGWTAERFGLAFSRIDPLIGIALAITSYVACIASVFLYVAATSSFSHAAGTIHWASTGLSPGIAAVVSVVNPIYEEIFLVGYVISVLKERRDATFAVNVSTAIRLLYHLYQGPTGVMVAVPAGLVFGYWFVRKGRLYPVIIAHALLDFFPFLFSLQF
jgi:membrane protease YdiL (CAAX protease family)